MEKKPNILIIMTDQQRKDSIGCYAGNNRPAHTPNIDALASEGMLLEKYFVQNPVCSPSRMCLFTGKYCSSLGIGTNGITLSEDTNVTLWTALKSVGYHTCQIGKLHFEPFIRRDDSNPFHDYGFDHFVIAEEGQCFVKDDYRKWAEAEDETQRKQIRSSKGKEYLGHDFPVEKRFHHSEFVTDQMEQYLKSRTDASPFIAIASYYAPHCPINPPAEYKAFFDLADMPLPILGENETFRDDLKGLTTEEWQILVRQYLALCAHLDDCTGRLIKTLKDKKLYDNTIIIYVADHGEYLGDHGRFQKGMPGVDVITNVPCIMKFPKHMKHVHKSHALIEEVDLMPTLLELAGADIPYEVQGESFKDIISGKKVQHKKSIICEFFNPGLNENPGLPNKPSSHKQEFQPESYGTMVRTQDYKLYLGNQFESEEILFDLKKDPYELKNVAYEKTYADIKHAMRYELIKKLQIASYSRRQRKEMMW